MKYHSPVELHISAASYNYNAGRQKSFVEDKVTAFSKILVQAVGCICMLEGQAVPRAGNFFYYTLKVAIHLRRA